jgi:uncharacterized protein
MNHTSVAFQGKSGKNMKIETERIPQDGLSMEHRMQANDFEILKLLIAKGEAEFIGTIGINLSILPLKDLIQVEGSVQARVRITCSRCAESYDAQLRRQFTLSYSCKIPQDLHRDETEGVELTAQQIGLILYQGDEIDLRDALAEQVVLALPYKPLCRQDCKGLCQNCGVNLNQDVCRCESNPKDGPFEVLKGLKFPSKR